MFVAPSVWNSCREMDDDDSLTGVPESTNMKTNPQSICPTGTQRKRMRKDEAVVTIPDDIAFSILSLLPASFLYEECRFACRAWAEMLRCPQFVKSHLSRTHPSGFLIQKFNLATSTPDIQSVAIEDWKNIRVSDVSLPSPGRIVCSSDGVVLFLRGALSSERIQHYIANPVTGRVLKLPDPNNFELSHEFSGIARIPNTGELKVVVLSKYYPKELSALTVGEGMQWRKLRSPPRIFKIRNFYLNHSYSVSGVVYSAEDDSVSAVDLCDESVHNVMFPEKSRWGMWGKRIVCSSDSLYLIDEHPIPNNGFLRLWLLKDLHRKEWVKIQNLNISGMPSLRGSPLPLIWLESEQVLVVKTVRKYLKGVEEVGSAESTSARVVSIGLAMGDTAWLAADSLLFPWGISMD
ncbi:hypothetical protein Tsubulata_040427 [Turnera subulata]|uniref:F-box domain-containing protein n=1 Tax=Turnera subulata TaxID=218843 RepID=A0A9Q0FWN4_9ROSI|nr:hypothetical protein Tsubulata_040427 [Turnera subulata]